MGDVKNQELSSERELVRQTYVIRDDLDMAVPVSERQNEIRLLDDTVIRISPNDLATVTYDHTGYAHFDPSQDAKAVLNKKGVAVFVQAFLVAPALDKAVPIQLNQKSINLAEDEVFEISPNDTMLLVFYGEKGQAIFFRDAMRDVIEPGPPAQRGVAVLSVPHQIFPDGSAGVIASKTLVQSLGQQGYNNVHTALFDTTGNIVGVRTSSGAIRSGGLDERGAVNAVEYYYLNLNLDGSTRPPLRIKEILQSRVILEESDRVLEAVHPDDISVILLDSKCRELGVLISNRRPSFFPGPASSALPGLTRTKPSPKPELSLSDRVFANTESHQQALKRLFNSTSSLRKTSPKAQGKNLDRFLGKPSARGRQIETSETYKTQLYFCVEEFNFHLPVKSNQARVKLASGGKLEVKRSQLVRAEYDRRGLLRKVVELTTGIISHWPAVKPGIAVKVQDYFLHEELIYAVPLTYGQTKIPLSNGNFLDVDWDKVVTVFYGEWGGILFSVDQGRIRMGPAEAEGLATTIQLALLLESDTSTSLMSRPFVLPINASEKHVIDCRDTESGGTTGCPIPIRPDDVCVLLKDEEGNVMYSQLSDGSLIPGDIGSEQVIESHREGSECNSEVGSVASSLRGYPRISGGGMAMDLGEKDVSEGTNQRSYSFTSRSTNRRREFIDRSVAVEQVEIVDKVVEVPEVRVVKKHVEKEQVEFETRIVRKKKIVERQVEHITYVPKIERKIIERTINVPKIIEVPVDEIIEQKVSVDNYVDEETEVIVKQTIVPVVTDTAEIEEEVECLELVPVVIPVKLFVPKLVRGKMLAVGCTKETLTPIKDVSLAHYNSLVVRLNPIFASNYDKLPLLKTTTGSIPLLSNDARIQVFPPSETEINELLIEAGVVGRTLTHDEKARVMQASPFSQSEVNAREFYHPPKTSEVM